MRSLEINRPVRHLKALKGKGIYAHAHVMSKSAKPQETIEYRLRVVNCLDIKQAVTFSFEKTGYEVLSPYITEKELILEPFEEKECSMKVVMSERIVEGGFEKHRLNVIPNGDGAQGQTLEFYSVRYLPHPYITNTEKGWDEVKEKAKNYEWAGKLADMYIQRAEEWEVPEAGWVNNGMFETANAHKCYNSAIAWKLTGRREFAEKSAEFLKRLSDRENGYPKRRKACSQQLVHEGEFFKSCAMAYDLIHDEDVISPELHEDIHYTFRLFVDFLDWALSDGGISNWSLAEIAGALYCSMDLQDRERIDRFVFGKGGAMDHLRAGVYSDGWWCECTIGYNQMAAGLFSEYTVALRPWGINIANWWVPAQYSNKVHFRNQHADGLCWDIYGENKRNYRSIEDLWDSLVMYKFFVQNSINHNMVTVDLKLQDPQEGRQVLFHTGKLFQASAVENCAPWSNPPYGGWRVMNNEGSFENRTWIEGRYVPIPENPPPYTKRTDFTEPVMQRRLAVLTDDYVVCFDYIKGEKEHDYDCIYHLPGLKGIENGSLSALEHTEQLVTDPLLMIRTL